MKLVQVFFCAFLVFAALGSMSAQEVAETETLTQLKKASILEQLDLTETQLKEIDFIKAKYEEKAVKVRTRNLNENTPLMVRDVKKLNTTQREEIRAVLTKPQRIRYDAMLLKRDNFKPGAVESIEPSDDAQ